MATSNDDGSSGQHSREEAAETGGGRNPSPHEGQASESAVRASDGQVDNGQVRHFVEGIGPRRDIAGATCREGVTRWFHGYTNMTQSLAATTCPDCLSAVIGLAQRLLIELQQ